MIEVAKVIRLHWEEKNTAIWQATLEVQFENGDIQMFVIPVTAMTNRISHADTYSNPDGIPFRDLHKFRPPGKS
jgi:hypothetical protein